MLISGRYHEDEGTRAEILRGRQHYTESAKIRPNSDPPQYDASVLRPV
jgi:hypothetical protein